MRWLRSFFYRDDPIIKVATGGAAGYRSVTRWLRSFFYSDDPIIKVATGLLEPEAQMWREILANEGVRCAVQIMDPVALSDGHATGTNTAIFVKQSDREQARVILAPLAERGQLVGRD